MHDDYKPLPTPDGTTMERCPVCGSEAGLWQFSTSETAPTRKLVCCARNQAIGPQNGLIGEGCLLYSPTLPIVRLPGKLRYVKMLDKYAGKGLRLPVTPYPKPVTAAALRLPDERS